MTTVYLTTADNPFNPKDDYQKWHDFDMQKGYYTAEYLNRIYEKNVSMKKGNDFDDSETDQELLEDSIDEIIQMNEELFKFLNEKDSKKQIKYVKFVSKS